MSDFIFHPGNHFVHQCHHNTSGNFEKNDQENDHAIDIRLVFSTLVTLFIYLFFLSFQLEFFFYKICYNVLLVIHIDAVTAEGCSCTSHIILSL